MALPPSTPRRRPIRVVFSSTALEPFVSVQKAAALAIAQLGVGAFFVSGVCPSALGVSAGWFVLAATVLCGFTRAIDIESWALLIPGGFVSRVTTAFGPNASGLATATAFVERLLLGALACVVVGHYAASVSATAIAGWRFTGFVRPEDLATLLAISTITVLWLRARTGRDFSRDATARAIWIGVAVLTVAVIWGVLTSLRIGAVPVAVVLSPLVPVGLTGHPLIDTPLAYLLGFGLTLSLIGSGEALTRAAHEFPPPRLPALKRTGLLTVAFSFTVATLGTFLVVLLIPSGERTLWEGAPLVGVAQHLAGPPWIRTLVAVAVAGAAVFILAPTIHVILGDAEHMLHRSAEDGMLSRRLYALHTRFGTPARAIDVTVTSTILVVLASGGRLPWLARAYAIAVAVRLLLTIASLGRLRHALGTATPFRTPLTFRLAGRDLPAGLWGPGLIVAATALAMFATGDVAAIAAAASIAILALWFTGARRRVERAEGDDDPEAFDLLSATELSIDQADVRPGNVLVPVRNPHWLAHVLAALQTPGDRDVVVMTVRLLDADVGGEVGRDTPTPHERHLLSEVVAVAERAGRPVRLLIVPARDVVDAIVGTVIRLRSADVYVGESSTLSAEDQGRLLGEAWEHAEKPEALDVRLVICHRSGRTDTYHLGAHPPFADIRRPRPDSPAVARRGEERRSARAPPRHRESGTQPDGSTTFGPRTRRRPGGDSRRSTACRRARGGSARARVRPAARHAAESPRR